MIYRIATVALLVACQSRQAIQPLPQTQAAEPASDIEAVSLLGQPLARPVLAEETKRRYEDALTEARQRNYADPGDVDAIIWLGRRTAYLGRYREAIDVYTRGMERHPRDARLYRHRGHRHITIRELD